MTDQRSNTRRIAARQDDLYSPGRGAAADYIGEMVLTLISIAASSRLPMVHYLLCMVWAETHGIVRDANSLEANVRAS